MDKAQGIAVSLFEDFRIADTHVFLEDVNGEVFLRFDRMDAFDFAAQKVKRRGALALDEALC